jgi:plasmid stability protein
MPAIGQLTVRLPEPLRRAIKRRAADEGTSVQAFVERILREAVQPDEALSDTAADALLAFVRTGAFTELSRAVGEDDPDLATM